MTGVKVSKMTAIAALCVVLLSLVGCFTASNAEGQGKSANSISQRDTPVQQKDEQSAATQKRQKPPVSLNPKLVAANTRFGFKLFSEILKQKPDENVFISPSSVAIALAMTYNGSSGSTQQGMAKALELQGMSLQEINQANAALKTLLENPDPKVQLAIANSLWAKQGVPFKPDFIQRNKTFYQAQVTDLDFNDPRAVGVINDWVKQNTQDKISKIIDELKPDAVLFLINAIYFKGKWTNEFDKQDTAPAPFYLSNGQQKQHPLMARTGGYRYLETDQFQAVSIPYGDRRVSLYVFLPKSKSDLTRFYKTLTPQNWDSWMNQFRSREGSLKLPRFTLEDEVQLNSALQALGMTDAFDKNRANFSNLSSEPTKIDEVKHKTFVEVNEEGTEAAATTSVGIVTTSMPMPEAPFQMVVDRPFFCAIRDNQTGTVLFMGSIVDPK